MDFISEPLRCPKCNALVVDRRSAVCTTCRTELPAEWIMSKEQAAKIMAHDREVRAEHTARMKILNDPWNQPANH